MGQEASLSQNKWDSQFNQSNVTNKLNEIDNSILKSKKMYENIDEYLSNEKEETISEILKPENTEIKNDLSITTPIQAYDECYYFTMLDTSNMVEYAKSTAPLNRSSDNKLYKASGKSARGSSLAPYYYDFESISGSYDCTNFVSHCLLAGNASFHPTKWYFNSISDRAQPNWAGVTGFGNFLLSNTSYGPFGIQDDVIGNAYLGDIVQFKSKTYNPSGYGHTAIFTGNPKTSYPLITHRSGNNWYQVNQPFFDKWADPDLVDFRIIKLVGYRS